MTPTLIVLAVAAGVVIVGWLLVGGVRVLMTMRRRSAGGGQATLDAPTATDADWIYGDRTAPRRQRRQTPGPPAIRQAETRRQGGGPVEAEAEAEVILRDARSKAALIREDARLERERLERRLAMAEQAALQITEKASEEAQGIVDKARAEAAEAVAEVARARALLDEEVRTVARERARLEAKHKRLSEFLLAALDEIEQASANGSADVSSLRELREELRRTD